MRYRLITSLEAVPVQTIRADQDSDPILTVVGEPAERHILWSTPVSREEYMALIPAPEPGERSLAEYQRRYLNSGIVRENPLEPSVLPNDEPDYEPWTAADPNFDPKNFIEQERQAALPAWSWRIFLLALLGAGVLAFACILSMYVTFGALP